MSHLKRFGALSLVASVSLVVSRASAEELVRICPTEPAIGVPLYRGGGGGGMAGDGWDGPGQGFATLFWHMENTTPDFGAGQRQALIDAMQAWANVVNIKFWEIPIPNSNTSVDWAFYTGNHCASEPAECGDPDCAFDGAGGVLAHAGFPPGVNSACVNPMAETWAGNVHFDEAENWEQDSEGGTGAFSLTLIAAHEVGHSIGLTHDTGPDGPHIMRPSFGTGSTMQAPSASDIANAREGYEAAPGSVVTLEQTGVWVDWSYGGQERGTMSNPFDTVVEGVGGVPRFNNGVILHVDAGVYPEAVTINKPMTVRAEGGVVTIGQ